MKMYCISVRNFTNTALRKAISRLRYLKWDYVDHFKRFWAALKLISIICPEVKELCYILLRSGWDLDFHLKYQKALDVSSEVGYVNGLITSQGSEIDFDLLIHEGIMPMIKLLKGIDPELWIPISVFPRYEYIKEPKMYLAFESLDIEDKLPEFRSLVASYIRSLDIKSLFIPPPDLVLKVDSSRYNDGGKVKRDYEKPEHSFDSGFLYQRFNPKPLGTREVWLPDRSTKINNSFWMIIGRQILRSDPVYPDTDSEVTWERIRDRLEGFFESFDISGFGFQYPRELLAIVADEICNLFPNPDLMEMRDHFKSILNSVKVQMEDGTFVYPPRGIGLGYYEDLKTIGMLAILKPYDPISVYGDQGLMPDNDFISIQRLKEFGFVLKEDKYGLVANNIKWSGWSMGPTHCRRPKQMLEPLVSLFYAQYHWERKNILRNFSIEFQDFYDSVDRYIPFQYELLFGFEFIRGDSLWNFRNSGVSTLSAVKTGQLKGWQLGELQTPMDTISDSLIYSTPFFTEWKRADAKQFSIKRKSVYRNSRIANTEIYEYANPTIQLTKSKKPNLPRIAGLISDETESKLIVNYGLTSGKFTFGLRGEEIFNALRFCSRARNPYEAYATGGYSVKTVWRCEPLICSEDQFMAERMTTSIDFFSQFMVDRLDVYNFNYRDLFPHMQETNSAVPPPLPLRPGAVDTRPQKRREEEEQAYRSRRGAYQMVSFSDMIETASDNNLREDHLDSNVSNILGDIRLRQTHTLVDVSDISDESGDEMLFVEEFGEDSSDVTL
ncbi:MAG: putative RNA-dependent RNA polymerase [Trichoderma tomentosum ormycovirus 1]|nr:MAG: putative RNA-dependent RNA polymerase [Trichoderma tomentosum ormycovirus 1]